ncbi:MAG TPA: hypothetical protein DD618_01375 [Acholeplasmatales bacterium]|nr:hypothetical protein [Acholeplasmatales bacterium]
MKLNDKINLIRQELQAEIPSVDKNRILETAQIEALLPSFAPTKPRLSFRSFGLQFALSALMITALIIPLALTQNNKDPGSLQDDDLATPVFNSSDEIYGFAAASIVSLAYNTSDLFAGTAEGVVPNDDLLVSLQLGFLNQYLDPIVILLGNETSHFFRLPCDDNNFVNQIKFEGVGLNGEPLLMDIYFNETLVTSTRLEIEILVKSGSDTFLMDGFKQINGETTTLSMTHYVNPDDTTNFIRVSKNMALSSDVYDFVVVKDSFAVSESRLALGTTGCETVATLINTLEEQSLTTYTIGYSSVGAFAVDYSIQSLLAITEPAGTPSFDSEALTDGLVTETVEEGQIQIAITEIPTGIQKSFSVTSGSVSDSFYFEDPTE